MKEFLTTLGTCFLILIGYVNPAKVMAIEEKKTELEEELRKLEEESLKYPKEFEKCNLEYEELDQNYNAFGENTKEGKNIEISMIKKLHQLSALLERQRQTDYKIKDLKLQIEAL